jgi:hypothetical protein
MKFEMAAEVRNRAGKGAARQLRRSGKIRRRPPLTWLSAERRPGSEDNGRRRAYGRETRRCRASSTSRG